MESQDTGHHETTHDLDNTMLDFGTEESFMALNDEGGKDPDRMENVPLSPKKSIRFGDKPGHSRNQTEIEMNKRDSRSKAK